jgi:hypothetical protein
MPKIIDPDLLADEASYTGATEVFVNTSTKTIRLTQVGDLSTDGVTEKALYSFLKEEWRNDPNSKNLAAFPFPFVPITDEFYELVDGWDYFDDATRYLIRDGGWLVRNLSGDTTQHWAAIKTTGSTESNDQLYYQLDGVSGVGTATNFQLTGPISQAVKIIDDPNGDGAYGDGFSRTTNIKVFNREESQLYSLSSTSVNGEATLTAPKVFGLDASTGDDLKITDTDANVAANSPFTQIVIRYFSQAFTRDVDSATDRNFGIVVDVGTHSGVDGSVSSGGATLTSAAGGITGSNYTGGTLVVHEGAAAGTYTISGTPTATVVTITGTFPATASNVSFTLQRATPIVATAEEIYTKIQYQLRQNSDIDATGGTVTGKVADELLEFVGDTLVCGASIPTNPNGGGSGVIIEGFSANDTNRLTFYDNSGIARTYPFVATLTLNIGTVLQGDTAAKFWVYYTTLPGASNDFGESGATLVDDNDGIDMTGNIAGQPSISLTYDYDNNSQGGRTPGTDADVTVVAIGLTSGQYVRATGTIQRSTSNTVSLVAALERNYANP